MNFGCLSLWQQEAIRSLTDIIYLRMSRRDTRHKVWKKKLSSKHSFARAATSPVTDSRDVKKKGIGAANFVDHYLLLHELGRSIMRSATIRPTHITGQMHQSNFFFTFFFLFHALAHHMHRKAKKKKKNRSYSSCAPACVRKVRIPR